MSNPDTLVLHVENNITSIVSGRLHRDLYKSFKHELGYFPPNAIWMTKRIKNWDGCITNVCFNRKWCKCFNKHDNVHFSTGLVSKAKAFFDKNYIDYRFIDKREKYAKKDLDTSFSEKYKLRDYQKKVVDEALGRSRGILKMSTGSGKTLTAAAIIAELGRTPTIFYVTSIDLLLQAKSELEKAIVHNGKPIEIGIIGDNKFDIKDVNVMTTQTAVRALGGKYKKFDEEDKTSDKTNVEKHRKEISDLIRGAKCIFSDECQHCLAETCQIIADSSSSARYRYGLSVHPKSHVEIMGDCFGKGEIRDIEYVWNKIISNMSDSNQTVRHEGSYEILQLDNYNIFSRGWNGGKFCWKKVRSIIRHKIHENCINVRYRGGNNLILTKDHSVFKLSGTTLQPEIKKLRANDLVKQDILLADNGNDWLVFDDMKWDIFEILLKNHLYSNKIRVKIDLSCISSNDLNISHQRLSQIKKRDSGIDLKTYVRYRHILPVPTKIYTEGARGVGISANLAIHDLLYLIGFWLGDGWFDGNNICFSVENSMIDSFIEKINSIKTIIVRPRICRRNSGCVEIKISNSILACLLKYLVENRRCSEKTLPDNFIFNISKKLRLQILDGMLDSDGCCLRPTKENRNKTECRYTTTSYKLANSLMCLLRSLNVPSTLSIRLPAKGGIIDGRQVYGRKKSYQIIFSKNSLNGINKDRKGIIKRFPSVNCNEYSVSDVQHLPYKGYVYDLEMYGHPSFVANGILVHNSATPYRDIGDDILIDACFGRTICDINASFLIKRGYLVKPEIFFIPVKNKKSIKFASYQEIYKNGIVQNELRNGWISQLATSMRDIGKVILILVRMIEHGNLLESMIEGSLFLHGTHTSKQREEQLNKMREGSPSITLSSVIFDEGVDIPALDTLILAGSGKSKTRALQRVGRTLRPFKNKKGATIIDFEDHCKHMLNHSRARRKIYRTEPEFSIKTLELD